MSRTKKRTKRTPQQRRKSSRIRNRTIEGKFHDKGKLQSPDSTPTNEVSVEESKVTRNVAAKDGAEKSDVAGNEKLRRSIPSTIDVDTPRRKSVVRSEETDLKTLLTVSNVVDDIVDRTVLKGFPESVKEVDTR